MQHLHSVQFLACVRQGDGEEERWLKALRGTEVLRVGHVPLSLTIEKLQLKIRRYFQGRRC